MKKNVSIILNILILISSSIGLYFSIFGSSFMNAGVFLYYTIQTNILTMLASILMIGFNLSKKKIPNFAYIIKYSTTCAIVITFLIFTIALVPQMILLGNAAYLISIGNLTVHFITPILAIISLIFTDNDFFIKKRTYLYGLIGPLYYLIFSMILSLNETGLFKTINGGFSKFPYFFLDYVNNGWFKIGKDMFSLGTVYWIIIIFLITLGISKLMIYCMKRVLKKHN